MPPNWYELQRELALEAQRQEHIKKEEPKPIKIDTRDKIKLTTQTSVSGTGIPLYTQINDTAKLEFTEGKPKPTGKVKFYICEEEDIQPGGMGRYGSLQGGCPIGKGKSVGNVPIKATRSKTSVLAKSEITIAEQVGQHCFRAEYSGDINYQPATHTTSSLNDQCFLVTRNQQAALPIGYHPPTLKKLPPGWRMRYDFTNVRDFVKHRGIVTPQILAEEFNIEEAAAKEWLILTDDPEIFKHPRRDEWMFKPKDVQRILQEQQEAEEKRRLQLEEEIHHKTDVTLGEEKANVTSLVNLGINIEEGNWDATYNFSQDIKKTNPMLLRAIERTIQKVNEHPNRGNPYGRTDSVFESLSNHTKSLIRSQCPSGITFSINATSEYRIIWCVLGEHARFLRFLHHGDYDYSPSGEKH